jgi:hypothetical protein
MRDHCRESEEPGHGARQQDLVRKRTKCVEEKTGPISRLRVIDIVKLSDS